MMKERKMMKTDIEIMRDALRTGALNLYRFADEHIEYVIANAFERLADEIDEAIKVRDKQQAREEDVYEGDKDKL